MVKRQIEAGVPAEIDNANPGGRRQGDVPRRSGA